MTYLELYKEAERKLEKNEITIGEYEEMIAPLRVEILEREKGEWIEEKTFGEGFYHCSVCGGVSTAFVAPKLYKFCPFCGADMDVDKIL